MFRLYKKEINTKYKNKYRSLVFNIRDEKNNGLFRKILNGTIKPKDLVKISSQILASAVAMFV